MKNILLMLMLAVCSAIHSQERDTAHLQSVPLDSVPAHSRWRINTNLLYWAALTYNAGVEYALDNKNYLMLHGTGAWWGTASKERVYRLMMGELAYMHNFKADERNTGWQLGVYAQLGLYEFMHGPEGRKGEHVGGGICAGYRWKIKEHGALHIDLGVGYTYTYYREAIPLYGQMICQGHKFAHYVGPSRVSVSYVWYLGGRKK